MDDIETVYTCSDFIHSYYPTKSHLILLESPSENHKNIDIIYTRKYSQKKSKVSASPLIVPNRLGIDDILLRDIDIVGNNQLQMFVCNTIDGIQFIPLEVDDGKFDLHNKWYLENVNDEINSMYSHFESDKMIINVRIGTKLGHLFSINYNLRNVNTLTNSIFQVQTKKNNYSVSDSINCVMGKPNTDIYVFSSFDNFFYMVINNKLERQSCSLSWLDDFHDDDDDSNDETDEDQKIITWIDFCQLKKYSNSYIIFTVCHVTNLGCILFKRTTRGEWQYVRLFRKNKISNFETSPLLDCIIRLDSRMNHLHIYCGSEESKLYYWKYNYRDDSLEDETNFTVSRTSNDLIHKLSISYDDDKIYFIHKNDTCISAKVL